MFYKQKGSVLVISLIMLLLLTIVGMSGVRISNLEERMSGNYRDHELAFHAAEAALSEGEAFIERTAFFTTDFQVGCTSNNCFTATCTDGLCFNGNFDKGGAPAGVCQVGNANPNLWESWANWANDNRVVQAALLTGTSAQARYIIEFRCFMPRDDTASNPETNILAQWAFAFRVTALAQGATDDSRVMLQSTYKKTN